MPYLEVTILLLLIILNGMLAMSELAIASSRIAKLRSLAEQHVHGSRRALALASDPGRFLSTVQIGITLIGIVAGAFSGATLAQYASQALIALGLSESVAEPVGFGAVITAITYLSLIVGELVPKQIALRNPERIACLVAPAMTLLARMCAPLAWFLSKSGHLILSFMGQSQPKDGTVTDSEIHSLIAEAESAGVLEPEERTMIVGVMRLGDRMVKSVMTPRTDVVMIDVSEPPAKIGKLVDESGHSRLVAHDGDPDNILGVLQAKDVATALLRKRGLKIKQLVRTAPVIPNTLDALEVVNRLKQSEVHFGLVYDEYGHFEGIVTTADILEAIVGAFKHDSSTDEQDIIERADGSLLVSGGTPIDVLTQRIGLQAPSSQNYQTVAGFILERLGRIPSAGDSFAEQGVHFEVVDLDGKRIDKVIVTRVAPITRRRI